MFNDLCVGVCYLVHFVC